MGLFDFDSIEAKAHEQVLAAPPKAQLSDDLIAEAASYEAANQWEDYCWEHRKPASFTAAVELLDGMSGAFIDRIVETKGLDYVDTRKAKSYANLLICQQLQAYY